MSEQTNTCKKVPYYAWAYGAFVLLALYFLVFSRDIESAMMNLGIALVFDPFNPDVAWQNRKTWQKAWLLVHVTIVFVLLGVMLLF